MQDRKCLDYAGLKRVRSIKKVPSKDAEKRGHILVKIEDGLGNRAL